MSLLRKVAFWICAGLLPLFLYGLAVSSTAVMIFGDAQNLKGLLADSPVYDRVADTVIENNLQKVKAGGLPLGEEQIDAAAKKALPPETIRNIAEQAIDSTYNWLEGETPTPTFAVDLTPIKQEFAANLGQQAGDKVSGLPTCTSDQLRQLDSQATLFDLPCRLPGFTPTSVSQQVSNEVMLNDKYFGDTTFNADDLPKNPAGETIFEQASTVPAVYQFAKVTPWLFAVGTIGLAAGVVFLGNSRRRGFQKIGVIIISAGLLLVISSWLARFFLNLSPIIRDFSVLNNEIFRVLLTFGTIYTAIGLVLIILLKLAKPKPQL